MTINADADLCQGHAMCVLEAPDVFAYDAKLDETVRILDPQPGEAQRDAVARAVRYCPTMALSLAD